MPVLNISNPLLSLPYPEFLVSLGLETVKVDNSANYECKLLHGTKSVGMLHYMDGSLVSVRARCMEHKNCICFVTVRVDEHTHPVLLFREMVQWLSLANKLSHKEHLEEAFHLKKRFGMAPHPL